MLIPPDCALGVCPGFDFGGLPLGLPLGAAGAGAGAPREILGRGLSAGSDIVVGFGVLVRDVTTTLEPSVVAAGSLSLAGMLKGTRGLLVDVGGLSAFSGIDTLAEGKGGGVSEMGVLGM